MELLTRRRLLALALLAASAGCDANPEGPKAPPPPAPGTVEVPKATAGVLKKQQKGRKLPGRATPAKKADGANQS